MDLAAAVGAVSGSDQSIREGRDSRIQWDPVHSDPVSPGIETCEQGGPGGHTERLVRIHSAEYGSLRCQFVDVRGVNDWMTRVAQHAGIELVCDYKKEIGSAIRHAGYYTISDELVWNKRHSLRTRRISRVSLVYLSGSA